MIIYRSHQICLIRTAQHPGLDFDVENASLRKVIDWKEAFYNNSTLDVVFVAYIAHKCAIIAIVIRTPLNHCLFDVIGAKYFKFGSKDKTIHI